MNTDYWISQRAIITFHVDNLDYDNCVFVTKLYCSYWSGWYITLEQDLPLHVTADRAIFGAMRYMQYVRSCKMILITL